MQKYGMLKDGALIISDVQLDGYKPIEYAKVPEFDQTSYYAKQGMIIDHEDFIAIGTEIVKVSIQEEHVIEEVNHEFVPRPPWEDKAPIDIIKAQVKATNDYMDFLEEVIVEMASKVYE